MRLTLGMGGRRGASVALGGVVGVLVLAGCGSGGGGGGSGRVSSSSTTQGSPAGGHARVTPLEVKKAKQALAECRQEQPGTTLRQLEQEAATPLGIQC